MKKAVETYSICNIQKCTGCRACISICPVQCISMRENKEGFLYPEIDKSECMNCKKCIHTCPVNQEIKYNRIAKAYAAQAKNKKILIKSASGGIGAVLANYYFNNGFAVIGCMFNDEYKAYLSPVETESELQKIQGSKYVQSDTLDSYEKAKSILETSRELIFFGCPCQIAGLKAFLGKEYSNLLTVDLICHGVCSPLLFRKYLEWRAKGRSIRNLQFKFRDKEKNGWGTICSFMFKNESKIYKRSDLDPYYSDFLEGQNYRESCYCCPYSKAERLGDITIGDYWGIKKEHPNFSENIKDGVSVVLLNTPKGEECFKIISKEIFFIPTRIEQISKYNKNLSHPTKRPVNRDTYYHILNAPYSNHVRRFYLSKKYVSAKVKSILSRLIKLLKFT